MTIRMLIEVPMATRALITRFLATHQPGTTRELAVIACRTGLVRPPSARWDTVHTRHPICV
jgi:hypothetical protein